MARGLNKSQRRIRDAAIARENSNTGGINQETSQSVRRSLPLPITPLSNGTSSSSSTTSSPVPIETPDRRRHNIENQEVERERNDGDEGLEESSNDTSASNAMDSFIAEQRAFNERVLRLLSNNTANNEQTKAKKQRLPLRLTESVRSVYKRMEDATSVENGNASVKLWNFEKRFDCQENASVNDAITRGVQSTEKNYPAAQLRVAIRTHFKTKKRRYGMEKKKISKQYLKSQRGRSRLNTKRLQRQKALNSSTSMPEEEKTKIRAVLSNAYMSSEESMSDPSDKEISSGSEDDEPHAQPKSKVLIVKKLNWRSTELSHIFYRMDRRITRKRSSKGKSMLMERKQGPASIRKAPENAPAWALNNENEDVV